MAIVGVTFRDATNAAVNGATVRIFSRHGVLLDEDTTGASGPGRVEFTLPGSETGIDHIVQLFEISSSVFHSALAYETTRSVLVYSTLPNEFELKKQAIFHDATSPAFCRCRMRWLYLNGLPAKGITVSVKSVETPTVLYFLTSPYNARTMLDTRGASIRTDDTGFAYIDLPRKGIFQFIADGWKEQPRLFRVPDTSSADFWDLLSVYVREATFSTASASLAVGNSVTFTVDSFLLSDGGTVDAEGKKVEPCDRLAFSYDGTGALSITWDDSKTIRLTATEAGNGTVSAVQRDPREWNTLLSIPLAPVIQTPIAVTIT